MDRPAISTGPALMIPAGYPRDLPSALLRAARDFGTAGVVEIGPDGRETRLDFPTLLELAARILAGLRANGVRAGDPAVVHCTEPVGFFAAFWACTLGGIRPLLIAPSPEGDTTEEGRERLRKVTDLLGWTVLIGRPSDLPNDLGLPVLDPDALAGHEPTSEFHRPAADDVAVLMMTSGTSTGTPKIIQLTHRGLVEFAAGTPAMLPVRPGQTTLNWLPLDHSGAFLLYHLLPVFTGCTNIHVATDWVLADPLRWLDLMDQHRVNHSWSPNFGYRLAAAAIANDPDRHWDLSALRSLVSGGEQITVPVVSEFLRLTNRFGVVPETFVAAWGMTETVTGITFARPGLTPNVHRVRIAPTGVVEWVDQRTTTGKVAVARPGKPRADAPGVLSLVSVGAPAPGTTVRIVGPNGAVLPEGRIGQLQVASARVTPGYLGNPDADRAAFPEGNWPARKWLATGDQGFISGGQVVITGRDSERIILNGQTYYAPELEAVAATAAGAAAGLVAACGVADPDAGTERLLIFYALSSDSAEGVDEAIRAVIRGRLGLDARVVGVPRRHFPTTPGGKILRPLLKQRWLDGTLETAPGPYATPPASPSPYGEPVRPGSPYAASSEFDEDASERTTELPVVRLAWRRTLTDSIPVPPERPTYGANRLTDEPLAADEDALSNSTPFSPVPVADAPTPTAPLLAPSTEDLTQAASSALDKPDARPLAEDAQQPDEASDDTLAAEPSDRAALVAESSPVISDDEQPSTDEAEQPSTDEAELPTTDAEADVTGDPLPTDAAPSAVEAADLADAEDSADAPEPVGPAADETADIEPLTESAPSAEAEQPTEPPQADPATEDAVDAQLAAEPVADAQQATESAQQATESRADAQQATVSAADTPAEAEKAEDAQVAPEEALAAEREPSAVEQAAGEADLAAEPAEEAGEPDSVEDATVADGNQPVAKADADVEPPTDEVGERTETPEHAEAVAESATDADENATAAEAIAPESSSVVEAEQSAAEPDADVEPPADDVEELPEASEHTGTAAEAAAVAEAATDEATTAEDVVAEEPTVAEPAVVAGDASVAEADVAAKDAVAEAEAAAKDGVAEADAAADDASAAEGEQAAAEQPAEAPAHAEPVAEAAQFDAVDEDPTAVEHEQSAAAADAAIAPDVQDAAQAAEVPNQERDAASEFESSVAEASEAAEDQVVAEDATAAEGEQSAAVADEAAPGAEDDDQTAEPSRHVEPAAEGEQAAVAEVEAAPSAKDAGQTAEASAHAEPTAADAADNHVTAEPVTVAEGKETVAQGKEAAAEGEEYDAAAEAAVVPSAGAGQTDEATEFVAKAGELAEQPVEAEPVGQAESADEEPAEDEVVAEVEAAAAGGASESADEGEAAGEVAGAAGELEAEGGSSVDVEAVAGEGAAEVAAEPAEAEAGPETAAEDELSGNAAALDADVESAAEDKAAAEAEQGAEVEAKAEGDPRGEVETGTEVLSEEPSAEAEADSVSGHEAEPGGENGAEVEAAGAVDAGVKAAPAAGVEPVGEAGSPGGAEVERVAAAAPVARVAEAELDAAEAVESSAVEVVGAGVAHRAAGAQKVGVGRGRKKGKGAAKGLVGEPVAIVGLAARFPGAATLEQFWDNLVGGVESIRRFTAAEVQQAGGGEAFGDDELVAVSGALEDVEAFDAGFFGLSAREAELTDPAQRMFLEVCQQALEHGGYAGAAGRIGVFAGSGMNLYTQQNQPSDSLATRVAYRLGLTGPAIGVQAAWSSSLVAVHLACQALRSGDADLALAGAAAVHVPQATGYHATPGSILSPSGHLRAFDAEADGTVGGNGVAAVLLKRLDQAVADGDTVYAVIKGSAVTNDGAATGQIDLIERALEKAGVPAESLTYVEANATGTAADDSVEFRALATALRKHTDKVGFCTIGSVKPNIGHLDSAAGMAGLIKTVLMLQHRTLVPTINYAEPNPDLQLANSPFVIGTEVRDWETATPLRAGVSALDAGGTSAHVILEEAPRQIRRGDDGPVVLPLSAPDPEALPELADLFRADLEHGTGHRLIDLAGTAAIGRPAHRHRLAVAGSSEAELAEALTTAGIAEVPRGGPGPLGFAFTGQGAARRGMAAGLAARFPVFRAVLDECDKVYEEEFGGSLLELLLTPAGSAEGVWPTETAQPALFAFEVALARLWQSFGVQPALVVGHSVGEYAALCVAGALSLADGVRLTAQRGVLMQRGTVPGAMVAVRADADRVRELAQTPGVEIAAGNGPQSFVLTGTEVIVGQLAEQLDRLELKWQRLDVDRAFHSSLVDPILADFAEVVAQIKLKPLRMPMVSSWSGELLESGTALDSDYLVGQLRQPVLFGDAVEALTAAGCRRFLELGPDAVLSPAGRRIAPNSTWIPAQRLGQDPVLATMNGLAELFEQGTEIAWAKVYPESGRVPLPTYPFRRVHHPVDASARPIASVRPPVVEERSIERSGAALKRIPLDPPRSSAVVAAPEELDSVEKSPFAIPEEDGDRRTAPAVVEVEPAVDAAELLASSYVQMLPAGVGVAELLESAYVKMVPAARVAEDDAAAAAELLENAYVRMLPAAAAAEAAISALAGAEDAPEARADAAAEVGGTAVEAEGAADVDAEVAAEADPEAEAEAEAEADAEAEAGAEAGGASEDDGFAEVDDLAEVLPAAAAGERYRESLGVVLDLTGEQLGLDPYDVTVDHTFAELGADSLSMLRVVEEVGQKFDVELAVSELFGELNTPHKLASAIASRNLPGTVDPLELVRTGSPVEKAPAGVPDSRTALAVLGSGLAELAAKVDAAAAATSEAELPGSGMAALMSQQLRVAGQLVDGVTKLMHEQLALLNAGQKTDQIDQKREHSGQNNRPEGPKGPGPLTGAGAPAKVEKAVAEKAKFAQAKVEKAGAEKAKVPQAKVEKAEAEKAKIAQAKVEKAEAEKAKIAQAKVEKAGAEKAKRARDLEYWQTTLQGAQPLVLPTDRPRPASDDAIATTVHELNSELGDAVFAFSRDRRVSPLMTMLAAIGTVLGRFAAQDDITLGTAALRRPGDTSTQPALPLRLDLSGEPDLGDLAQRIREITTVAFDHASVDLAVLEQDPLFQVLVEFEDGDGDLAAELDVRFRLAYHGDGITCTADYRAGLFNESTIKRLLDYLEAVLRRAIAEPDQSLPELMLPIESDQRILAEFEGEAPQTTPVGRVRRDAVVAGELSGLHTLFEQQVARTPDAVALIQGDRELTYTELDRRSNAVAWQLVDLGVKPGQLVAVRVARGAELVVAVLAVLKSGAAYLPLDPGVPESRWAFMTADAGAVALVGDDAALADRLGLRLVPVAAADGDPRAKQAPPVRAAADDIAYCIYTSGSNGNPKGVAVPHRGPVNLVRHYLRTRRSLRTLQWTSFGFDVHVQEMFTVLASGAALVLIGEDDRYDPDAVVAALKVHGVERLFMAFSPLTALLATMRKLPELPALREIVAGGEAMVLTHKIRDFLAAHPECTLYNEYGPTEASVVTTIHHVDPDEDRPSIGRPIDGVVVRLLDEALRPVPVGAIGEIHLGGVAVAHGYLGRPDETETAFVSDPAHPGGRLYRSRDLGRWRSDGSLDYLGRADDQVKIRGHRVEPGETEHVLADLPGVIDAVVIACADPAGDTCLIGYVVLEDSDPAVLAQLLLDLTKELPIYLVPADLIPVEDLPLDDSGKLDRSRLPEPEWLKD
ncbi:hypothetical protein GCM10009789_42510 [Kribbella sancticallisti]|uniref:Amino acid adenylation domain-containing protein n=1 Tax=Kribbella sancticallisti TaxID=460087 RepID=A0ABN2DRL8_9ACTN